MKTTSLITHQRCGLTNVALYGVYAEWRCRICEWVSHNEVVVLCDGWTGFVGCIGGNGVCLIDRAVGQRS